MIKAMGVPLILTGKERAFVDRFAFTERADTEVVSSLMLSIVDIFEFAERAVLFWTGCTRTSEAYDFPAGLREKWKQRRAGRLDARMNNGPPYSAFVLAGGRK